jgi:hypothetical protein
LALKKLLGSLIGWVHAPTVTVCVMENFFRPRINHKRAPFFAFYTFFFYTSHHCLLQDKSKLGKQLGANVVKKMR